MTPLRFLDQDEAYEDWQKQHQHGYVLNIRSSTQLPKLHRANCWHLDKFYRSTKTEKVCDVDRQALEIWARNTTGGFDVCKTCDV